MLCIAIYIIIVSYVRVSLAYLCCKMNSNRLQFL